MCSVLFESMEDVEDVFCFGQRKLGYIELRECQRKAVWVYVSWKDVCFRSPGELGKSLCFEIAPFVIEGTQNRCGCKEC